MLNKKVYDLLISQINAEIYSAYLYYEFANIFHEKGLIGFAHYYEVQAKEEFEHAQKIRNYVIENNMPVRMEDIKKPDVKSEESLEIIKQALVHEVYVTSLINKIYEAALEVKEYKTVEFLSWFVKEQVEEEANATALLGEFEALGKTNEGLYLLNKQLSKRED